MSTATPATPPMIIRETRLAHDHSRAFFVASRTTPDYWYTVVVGEHTLSCDCKSSQYRNRCAHRQAVHDFLVAERERLAR